MAAVQPPKLGVIAVADAIPRRISQFEADARALVDELPDPPRWACILKAEPRALHRAYKTLKKLDLYVVVQSDGAIWAQRHPAPGVTAEPTVTDGRTRRAMTATATRTQRLEQFLAAHARCGGSVPAIAADLGMSVSATYELRKQAIRDGRIVR